MKWISALLFTTTIALIAALVWLKRDKTHPPQTVATAEPNAATEEQLRGLRGEVALLRATQAGLADAVSAKDARAAASAAASTPPAPTEAEDAVDPELAETRRQELRQAQAQLIDTSFQTEPTDPEWSAPSRDLILNKYRVPEFSGVSVAAAECRSTMCRLDLQFEATADASDTAQRMAGSAPLSRRGYMRVDPATGRGVYYLLREGHEFPQLATTGDSPSRALPAR